MYKKIDIQLKTFHALLKSLSFKSQKKTNHRSIANIYDLSLALYACGYGTSCINSLSLFEASLIRLSMCSALKQPTSLTPSTPPLSSLSLQNSYSSIISLYLSLSSISPTQQNNTNFFFFFF